MLFRSFPSHDTDAFIAVTSNSEANILACMAAKRLGVKKTVAEVENIDYIMLAESMDIGTVINKVYYWTGQNSSTKNTLAASNYYLDAGGNRVVVTGGLPEPLAQNLAYPIEVEFTVNANFEAQYPVVKQAALMLLTHLYNNRDTVGDSVQQKAQIPFGVSTLLRPYKPLIM